MPSAVCWLWYPDTAQVRGEQGADANHAFDISMATELTSE